MTAGSDVRLNTERIAALARELRANMIVNRDGEGVFYVPVEVVAERVFKVADAAGSWNDTEASEKVIDAARALGFCNEQFTRSYGTFMDSPISAKNELTVSAWSKAKEAGAEFLVVLQKYDALASSVPAPLPPNDTERLRTALTDLVAKFDAAIQVDDDGYKPTELYIGPMRKWFDEVRAALAESVPSPPAEAQK